MELNTSEDSTLIGPGCSNREIKRCHSLDTTSLGGSVCSPTEGDTRNNMNGVAGDGFSDYTPNREIVAKGIQDALVALGIK